MSGFYNNWLKVQHPEKNYIQTTSEGYQKPFYFGGSQVPLVLYHYKENNINGGFINESFKGHLSKPSPNQYSNSYSKIIRPANIEKLSK